MKLTKEVKKELLLLRLTIILLCFGVLVYPIHIILKIMPAGLALMTIFALYVDDR